jgi:hypothetical protein
VYGFARNQDGTLNPINTNSDAAPINDNIFRCPFATSASSAGFLAVLMSTEGVGVSTSSIVLYTLNADGSLTFVPGSIVNAAHASNIGFDPSGTYLAAVTSTGQALSAGQTAGIQIYQLSNGKLIAVGGVQNPETNFEVAKWDNSGHLYALSTESNALFVYSMNQGVLTEAPGSPHMVTLPGSIAVVSTIQYQVSLFNVGRNAIFGQVSVDSSGAVTASLHSAAASATYSLQFCPAPSQMYECFAVGNVVTDASGNSTATIPFPTSGDWAGDFQLSLNGTAQYQTDVVPNAISAVYLGRQQPATTVNGQGIFQYGSPGPQDPLTGGTVTLGGGELLVQLTGASPNSAYNTSECPTAFGSSCYELYNPNQSAFKTDSSGNASYSVLQDGTLGDIFQTSQDSGHAGFVAGFRVP